MGADFPGLWNQEDRYVDNCVECITGYFVCIGNCPVLWISHLKESIALSTMEAEYMALSITIRSRTLKETTIQYFM